jgi:ubiquinone/menaquinone biosynthesis C-methylase UbiE
MVKEAILETYSKAALQTEKHLCCGVDYRKEFGPEELDHIPERVLDRNYGCGVPAGLRSLNPGDRVLDLGPGFGRDCFIAARKVGPEGCIFGLDMNDTMLEQAERYKNEVVRRLGYDNIRFLKGQFDVEIPLEDNCIDVILSNCVNNLAEDKSRAYSEMFRVMKPGSSLSFADVVSYDCLPPRLQENEKAWADCVAGVLSFQELARILNQTGFHGVTLRTEYLWKAGIQLLQDYFSSTQLSAEERQEMGKVRLYSVAIEAFKPVLDPKGECFWRNQYALFHGPGAAFQLDNDPDHLFKAGELKEICEKTATILKSEPFNRHFTVFEPEGEMEARPCLPEDKCC